MVFCHGFREFKLRVFKFHLFLPNYEQCGQVRSRGCWGSVYAGSDCCTFCWTMRGVGVGKHKIAKLLESPAFSCVCVWRAFLIQRRNKNINSEGEHTHTHTHKQEEKDTHTHTHAERMAYTFYMENCVPFI